MTAPFILPLSQCTDPAIVGGKAANLGMLIRAGFPVPDGFVVTTDAQRQGGGNGNATTAWPTDLEQAIRAAYRAMGAPPVAVRSSATAEDMADASMAGQYDTHLDITGEDALLHTIRRCWASLDSPRTRAYFKEHGIDASRVAMAVVVQKLVPADVAGVLFTADPSTGGRGTILIEASWGLGEAVVSGLVQPDIIKLDRMTGKTVQMQVADKQVWIKPGSRNGGGYADHEPQPVEEAMRTRACLGPEDVGQLLKLARAVDAHFGRPQDVEWAIAGGEVFLLQSRPITTLGDLEAQQAVLRETIETLRDRLAKCGGPWVVHNLAETLPHPTPLTWSVIRRFMTGDGGFGAMYRMSGFEPSAKVASRGFLDLIAGRVYMDLSLAPEMFFAGYPYRYDPASLRNNPDAGQAPPTLPSGTPMQLLRAGRRVAAMQNKLRSLAATFDRELREKHIPAFVAWCKAEKARDLRSLSDDELIATWHDRDHRVLGEFAPLSLLPGLVIGMAIADLRQVLAENFWDDDPDTLTHDYVASSTADMTVRGNADLQKVATGGMPVEAWLAEHGHRAPGEFDLSTPRWRERPDQLLTFAKHLVGAPDPLAMHHRHADAAAKKTRATAAQLGDADRERFTAALDMLNRYLPFREDGKHYLMLGYDLLRDAALEMRRRIGLDSRGEPAAVFLLSEDEMIAALRARSATAIPQSLSPGVDAARRRYRVEARIPLPSLIDSESLASVGVAPTVSGDGVIDAMALSPGVATGSARIVLSPETAGELGHRYILVCPSTDPAWTPLFADAAGIVLERGGSLSHGAVVAREMGIPAVVMPGATTRLQDGQTVTIDGTSGKMVHGGAGAAATPIKEAAPDASDARIAHRDMPPPVGSRERFTARLRNVALIVWGAYLLAAFLLPAQFAFHPSLKLLDALLWPVVRAMGKPWTVAVIAGTLAAASMILQRLVTDTARLREAKRRANVLQKQATKLPRDSARAKALRAVASPVPMRLAGAAMVPIALLLGPMVMSFAWLPERVDPASWSPSATPGMVITVTAAVRSNVAGPVRIAAPPLGLELSASTPESQTPPPIRATLESLLQRWQSESTPTTAPAYLPVAWQNRSGEERIATLRSYLERGVPAQELSWKLQVQPGAPQGRFPITVCASGPSINTCDSITIVLGDHVAPEPAEVDGGWLSPIASLKVTYPATKPVPFWTPLARLHVPWDFGWLGVYLVAYIPVMFGLRWLLRVP